jgi:hypothetical protein
MVTRYEDRDTVMIPSPVIDLFHGAATREDRAGRVDLVQKVPAQI